MSKSSKNWWCWRLFANEKENLRRSFKAYIRSCKLPKLNICKKYLNHMSFNGNFAMEFLKPRKNWLRIKREKYESTTTANSKASEVLGSIASVNMWTFNVYFSSLKPLAAMRKQCGFIFDLTCLDWFWSVTRIHLYRKTFKLCNTFKWIQNYRWK